MTSVVNGNWSESSIEVCGALNPSICQSKWRPLPLTPCFPFYSQPLFSDSGVVIISPPGCTFTNIFQKSRWNLPTALPLSLWEGFNKNSLAWPILESLPTDLFLFSFWIFLGHIFDEGWCYCSPNTDIKCAGLLPPTPCAKPVFKEDGHKMLE